MKEYCGSCGKDVTDDQEHDSQKCWDENKPCPGCGGLHGYDWDSDPLKKICKGCGLARDKV